MSGRRIRNLVLLALLAGAGYWYYRDRPTLSKIVDRLTSPLMGSKAAVKESENKRVMSAASTVISLQTDENVGMLRVGMTKDEVRDLLGDPDSTEALSERAPVRARWLYRVAKRAVVFENGRVVSIAIL
ncbi:MAG: outer membrane protein assembly factor BamE [Acidobacteriota bacterium]